MRSLVRIVATVVVALLAFDVLIRALHWMNQPSDSGWYGGIAVVLGLVLLVPLVVRAIWRVL